MFIARLIEDDDGLTCPSSPLVLVSTKTRNSEVTHVRDTHTHTGVDRPCEADLTTAASILRSASSAIHGWRTHARRRRAQPMLLPENEQSGSPANAGPESRHLRLLGRRSTCRASPTAISICTLLAETTQSPSFAAAAASTPR